MSPLKLAYTPLSQSIGDEQKALSRSKRAKEHACLSVAIDKAKIAAYSFTASSGEAISFFEEGGVWKAKVACPVEGITILPVVCEHAKQIFPVLQSLSQQKANLHKHRIHMLHKGQAKSVFVGFLAVQGGVEGADEHDLVALHGAIRAGDVALAKTLLTSGADPNRADEIGFTPLQLASIKGHLEIVKLLLANEANLNIVDKHGDTALHWAAYCGQLDIVDLLLEQGADPNAIEQNGFTPCHLAIEQGYVEIVSILLAKGADPNRAICDSSTPLHWTAYCGQLDIVDLLLEQGANPNITDQDGFTPLYRAIEGGHIAIVKRLLAKGADPNKAIANNNTPLHMAAYSGHLELVNLLLEKRADHTITDQDGFTPLYRAIDQGHIAIVSLLLTKGADLNVPIADKSTPLHWAAYDGNLALVTLLLEAGANPTVADLENCTPLHMAAYRGHMSIILKLLSCELDVNAQDDHGDTFLYSLIEEDSLSLEERLNRFLEAIQGIEKKQDVLLSTLTEVMEDYCPELTNRDTRSILARVVNYVQGVDFSLKNQDDKSIVDIIGKSLVEETNVQGYEAVIKTLDRHQRIGGWMSSQAKNKRKASTSTDVSSKDGIQAPALKKPR